MKTVVLIFTLLVSSIFANAQEAKGTIKVTIDNVTSDEGKVIVALHTSDTFLRGNGVMNQESTIKNGKVSFVFENVPAGTYAIMALHDVNENNRMDFEDSGMPKESYGMSGNEMAMGPPTFDMAKFEANGEDLEFKIRF